MADLVSQIESESAQPKSITSPGGMTTTEHSLPDQIAADKYLKQDAAAKAQANGKLPIGLFKIQPPGAV